MKGRVLLSILSYSCAVKVAKLSHQEVLASFSEKVFDPASEDPDVAKVMSTVSDRVDLASALKTVQHKDLPASVAHLVQSTSEGKAGFDDASLEKARFALNDLVEKAWIELDTKILDCKMFAEMNRENHAQVTRDISRLVNEITDLNRIKSEAVDGIEATDKEIEEAEELMRQHRGEYNKEKAENDATMIIRKNDEEVFRFILEFTKCDESASLLQASYEVCEMSSGRRTLIFRDQHLAKKFKALLTSSSRHSLDSLLSTMGTTQAPHAPSFFQVNNQQKPKMPRHTTDDDDSDALKSCSPDPPDCGLLHDKLSLMWGEYKDSLDELATQMAKNNDNWEQLQSEINGQIALLSKKKSRFTQLAAEAVANLATGNQERKNKEQEKRTLDDAYQAFMTQCKRRIEWIMFQDMCAIKVVRNAVMENSTSCPTADIVDCDVSAWVRGECSVSCDDSCDPNKPLECGGMQPLTRTVVERNNGCGIKCPRVDHSMRCGQFLCPVDCEMSEWSGWSACSADCEGGVQAKTRSILHKTKNGGAECTPPMESRPCNTESCDRDCSLDKWTRWSSCSMACGGGLQERRKHVVRPIRGDGKCPISENKRRYRQRKCNTKRCQGDEVCKARQDVVIAIDGSGSVQESGFDILKNFAETLVSRYQTRYWGRDRAQIGICQFGNGEIMADGTSITPAINVQSLTLDKPAVLTAVKGLVFKKGFTNMAQAFATAENMFMQKSRKGAQQAVLVISDGKPSFSFETTDQVKQLDEKNVMRYFVVISEQGVNSVIKGWASQPWETNVVHVPGLEQLDGDIETWAQKAVTVFCPQSISPSQREKSEQRMEYQKVYTGGWCKSITHLTDHHWRAGKGGRSWCKDKAAELGHQVFVAKTNEDGTECFSGEMTVSPTQYEQWFDDKANPECADGWENQGGSNMYAIYPKDEQVCAKMGIDVSVESDCTGHEVWNWKGGMARSYDAEEWTEETYDAWGGAEGTCVTRAKTEGRTCKQYCEARQTTCHRGQIDAPDQMDTLSYWLQGQGRSGTQCAVYDDGQTLADNGCSQELNTQLCACKKTA